MVCIAQVLVRLEVSGPESIGEGAEAGVWVAWSQALGRGAEGRAVWYARTRIRSVGGLK